MTDPETHDAIPLTEPGREAPDSSEPEAAEPQPEPWTPARVSEWNAYYDVYVMLGVLLLTFVAASNRITTSNSSLWSRLQVGRTIAAKAAPVTTDTFSFTQEGKPWVNVPWLFDWSHAQVYRLALEMTPNFGQADPAAAAAQADQVAAGVLIGLGALARLLTAWLLMRVRRPGPGLWWTALCSALAVGACLNPAGLYFGGALSWVAIGGIAGPGQVSPDAWGLLLLAVEVWLIHRAWNGGRRGSAFALVPLFALWANLDESFIFGLLILAAAAVGSFQPRRAREKDQGEAALRPAVALGVLGASALACLLNPSFLGVYPAALAPVLGLFRASGDVLTTDQLSFFGEGIRQLQGEAWKYTFVYYVGAVAIGYGSFLLNWRRFSLGRFLAYTVAAVLWGALIRFGPEFAIVFAATLALNGQEWYHDRFGTQGRLGAGWTLWSVGGRLLTLAAVFFCVFMGLTGYGRDFGDAQFGFGYDPGDFPFEAADFLKTAPVQGPVLNTMAQQGDALIWRAAPARKTYIDGRSNLFPPEMLTKLQDFRRALSEDDVEKWKPFLDEYKATAVMLDAARSTRTIRVLSQSPEWVEFYDDGNTVIFGRSDATEGDLAFFKANRLEPDELAFKRSKPVPAPERPPTPVTWMDTIFRQRALSKSQPHAAAAARWLSPPGAEANPAALPSPARCLLAVREARTALASRPDDPQAFRLLADAYRDLMLQEAALLSGIALTPENAAQIRQINPRTDLLINRFRQRVAALNYAIQTTPPPESVQARVALQGLNLQLAQLYMGMNYLDLARDRFQAVLDGSAPADFSPEFRTQLSQQVARFNEQLRQAQDQMTEMTVEQQLGPVQLAAFARNSGAPGLALHHLEEAERTGTNPSLVKPQLLDLYCDTGQPDKALEILSSGTIGDPAFGTEPGASEHRQATSYFLFGNSDYAATLWEKYAIPRLRYDRGARALGATQALLRGEAKAATGAYMELPEKISQQALWEYDAGLARLEGGVPEVAAEHFTKALTLAPKMAQRPIIAYYLEKMGKPVPPAPTPAKPEEDKPRKDESAKGPSPNP
jgi:tetratricopeptide (TPR) repeat protein